MGPAALVLLTGITDIADSACLAVMVAVTAGYWFWLRRKEAACALLFAFFAAAAGIGLSKLLFLGCLAPASIHSPSGHAALSVAVFGIYGWLVTRSLQGIRRWLLASSFATLVIAVAVSRVVLGFHSTAEAVFGLCIGVMAWLCAYQLFLAGRKLPPVAASNSLFFAVIALFATHGMRLHAEPLLRLFASHVQTHVAWCRVAF